MRKQATAEKGNAVFLQAPPPELRQKQLTGDLMPRARVVYTPDVCDRLPELMQEGQSLWEVCRELGISQPTFYSWLKEHPELRQAYELAQTYSLSWWTKIGRQASSGLVKINSAAWIFNMKNRAGWKDKVEVDVTAIPKAAAGDEIDGLSLEDAATAYSDAVLNRLT